MRTFVNSLKPSQRGAALAAAFMVIAVTIGVIRMILDDAATDGLFLLTMTFGFASVLTALAVMGVAEARRRRNADVEEEHLATVTPIRTAGRTDAA
ncbi:hypothetical protein [Curtobacterium sp. MCBD17_040]|uniref:hypothetical protein n=1 Tax=Curtobacterium sp. MCBD17_040 TaxID=2175674 RepID=UPI000DA9B72B|nr:hypothetical protein [Curtobacterium sp. MCBD17_040]WIB65507.1 hypothetical protein DEI94_19225 [Curtobacterium sp. MCBD17_040]